MQSSREFNPMQIKVFLGKSERKALILTVEPLCTSTSCTVACFLLAIPIHTYFSSNPGRRCKAPEISPRPHLYLFFLKSETRSIMKHPAAVAIRSLNLTSSARLGGPCHLSSLISPTDPLRRASFRAPLYHIFLNSTTTFYTLSAA